MNECPTRVRTGTPPCSRITSGTAREQIRLCRIVAPGLSRSTPTASSAVVVDPDSPLPDSSTTNTRSASPSKARPTSKEPATTRARTSRWLAGCSGSAGWLGNVPSSSPYMTSSSTIGKRSNTAGTTSPPIPLAVSATTRVGRSCWGSMKERTWSTKRSSRSCVDRRPRLGAGAGPVPARDAAINCLISSNPAPRPSGRAPARHSLAPLYSAGLCDAVNIAPGRSRAPAAK